MKSLAIATFTLIFLAASVPAQQRAPSHPAPSAALHGSPQHTGRGSGSSHSRKQTVYVPYAYPVAVPAYGYTDPAVTYYPDQPAPPPQPVEQSFAPPAPEQPREPADDPNAAQPAEDYTPRFIQSPAPTPQEWAMSEGHYYLIAAKDHSVYTALAYWMEGGALHYVTPLNAHSQITLDLLDLPLTKKLNSGRGLGFNLKQ